MASPPIPDLRPPSWVYDRLTAAGGPDGARYEASLYGPLNAFLGSYFPIHRRFMVKPQPKIRPEFVTDPDDFLFRHSLDSYHAEVVPRSLGGSENPIKVPDFIVAKATSSRDNDRLLLVVEVKPQDKLDDHAEEQLIEYLEILADKHRKDTEEPLVEGSLHGLLVIGDTVKLLTLPLTGTIGSTSRLDFAHGTVNTFIRSIVVKNW